MRKPSQAEMDRSLSCESSEDLQLDWLHVKDVLLGLLDFAFGGAGAKQDWTTNAYARQIAKVQHAWHNIATLQGGFDDCALGFLVIRLWSTSLKPPAYRWYELTQNAYLPEFFLALNSAMLRESLSWDALIKSGWGLLLFYQIYELQEGLFPRDNLKRISMEANGVPFDDSVSEEDSRVEVGPLSETVTKLQGQGGVPLEDFAFVLESDPVRDGEPAEGFPCGVKVNPRVCQAKMSMAAGDMRLPEHAMPKQWVHRLSAQGKFIAFPPTAESDEDSGSNHTQVDEQVTEASNDPSASASFSYYARFRKKIPSTPRPFFEHPAYLRLLAETSHGQKRLTLIETNAAADNLASSQKKSESAAVAEESKEGFAGEEEPPVADGVHNFLRMFDLKAEQVLATGSLFPSWVEVLQSENHNRFLAGARTRLSHQGHVLPDTKIEVIEHLVEMAGAVIEIGDCLTSDTFVMHYLQRVLCLSANGYHIDDTGMLTSQNYEAEDPCSTVAQLQPYDSLTPELVNGIYSRAKRRRRQRGQAALSSDEGDTSADDDEQASRNLEHGRVTDASYHVLEPGSLLIPEARVLLMNRVRGEIYRRVAMDIFNLRWDPLAFAFFSLQMAFQFSKGNADRLQRLNAVQKLLAAFEGRRMTYEFKTSILDDLPGMQLGKPLWDVVGYHWAIPMYLVEVALDWHREKVRNDMKSGASTPGESGGLSGKARSMQDQGSALTERGPLITRKERCTLTLCPDHRTPNRDSCACEQWFPPIHRRRKLMPTSPPERDNHEYEVRVCIFVTDTRPIQIDLRSVSAVTTTDEWWSLSYAINFLYARSHGYHIERRSEKLYQPPVGSDEGGEGDSLNLWSQDPSRKVGWAKMWYMWKRLNELGQEKCTHGVSIDSDAWFKTSEKLENIIDFFMRYRPLQADEETRKNGEEATHEGSSQGEYPDNPKITITGAEPEERSQNLFLMPAHGNIAFVKNTHRATQRWLPLHTTASGEKKFLISQEVDSHAPGPDQIVWDVDKKNPAARQVLSYDQILKAELADTKHGQRGPSSTEEVGVDERMKQEQPPRSGDQKGPASSDEVSGKAGKSTVDGANTLAIAKQEYTTLPYDSTLDRFGRRKRGNGGFFIVRNDPAGLEILQSWYESPETFPQELGVYRNRHSQGLNRCFDTAIRDEEMFRHQLVFGPPEFFTGPRAKVIEHNWFKKQDKILPDLKERFLQRIQQRMGCVVCAENFDPALAEIEKTYY
ncbi:unnamed protein product [Amoebophrya sp. A25]|nr:unnamed protein product [Amoebophrya sp. A25]|eukprot:GSA25T00005046001.1